MIRRRRRVGLKIVLAILLLLILAASIFAVIKRDALMLAVRPSSIELNDRQTVRDAVLSNEGRYKVLDDGHACLEDDPYLLYQTKDEAFSFDVQFEGEAVKRVKGTIDVNKATEVGIPEGISLAEELLSPYLSKSEMEAVELILMSDILDITSRTVIDYTRDVGNMTIAVSGSLDKNDLNFILKQKNE